MTFIASLPYKESHSPAPSDGGSLCGGVGCWRTSLAAAAPARPSHSCSRPSPSPSSVAAGLFLCRGEEGKRRGRGGEGKRRGGEGREEREGSGERRGKGSRGEGMGGEWGEEGRGGEERGGEWEEGFDSKCPRATSVTIINCIVIRIGIHVCNCMQRELNWPAAKQSLKRLCIHHVTILLLHFITNISE